LSVRIVAEPADDPGDYETLARTLREELRDTDADSVEPIAADRVPEGAKGWHDIVGWLAVNFGTAQALRSVVSALRDWTSRTGRVVEVTDGTDVLRLSGVTSEQQDKIIDAWLARHGAAE
jgi:hypothetical protein